MVTRLLLLLIKVNQSLRSLFNMEQEQKSLSENVEISQQPDMLSHSKSKGSQKLKFNDVAYSVVQLNNKWAVVKMHYDAQSLTAEGTVSVVEVNTNKLIVQERLNIILNKEEIL